MARSHESDTSLEDLETFKNVVFDKYFYDLMI